MAQAGFTIYSLTDKRDHIVCSIGVSNDPVRRYKEHISRDDGGSRSKEAWIAGLARLGMVPEVNFIRHSQNYLAHLPKIGPSILLTCDSNHADYQ